MPPSAQHSDHGLPFAEALASGAQAFAGSFAVGGRRLAVRCLGARHWADLNRSLIAAAPGPADLALDLWDPGELGRPAPPEQWPEPAALTGGAEATALHYMAAGELIGYRGHAFDVVFDRAAAAGSGWVDARRVMPWQRLRPWQDLFVAALLDF